MGLNILTKEEIKDISYPAKMADLMARKVKTLMEIVKKIGYEVFAIYRVLLGVALIVTYLVRL